MEVIISNLLSVFTTCYFFLLYPHLIITILYYFFTTPFVDSLNFCDELFSAVGKKNFFSHIKPKKKK